MKNATILLAVVVAVFASPGPGCAEESIPLGRTLESSVAAPLSSPDEVFTNFAPKLPTATLAEDASAPPSSTSTLTDVPATLDFDDFLSNPTDALDVSENFEEATGEELPAGGQFRYRYMNEKNRLRPQGDQTRDTYHLFRVLINAEIDTDWLQLFASYIDAVSSEEELPPAAIDENRSDLLEFYADLRIYEIGDDGAARIRYGRQLLNYGSQHLVSSLDWANTLRNFEGGRLYYASSGWDLDAFVVRPVNAAAGNSVRSRSRDLADQSALFSGIYSTWKPSDSIAVDLFWLWLDESEPKPERLDGNVHIIGARYTGTLPIQDGESTLYSWLWDIEGGGQFGRDNFISGGPAQDVLAAYFSLNAGLKADSLPLKPTLKGIFWYGSGDGDPNDGRINTFSTLYPDSHTYWGVLDNFNGSNLLDYAVAASIVPFDDTTFSVTWHAFDKAQSRDFIYNVSNEPLGDATTGAIDLGHELDLVLDFAGEGTSLLQIGYSWFWYGDAVTDQPALNRSDASQLYVMVTVPF
jgi:hypothetical protein